MFRAYDQAAGPRRPAIQRERGYNVPVMANRREPAGLVSRSTLPMLALAALVCFLALACGGGKEKEVRQVVRMEPPLASELVTSAEFPVSLAFAPDGRLFYNEFTTGNVRIITASGQLLPQPFAHVDVAVSKWTELGLPSSPELWGLLGLAIDPDFEQNHYVYVYFMEPTLGNDEARPVVMRFTDQDNVGISPKAIVGDLEESRSELGFANMGGGIHFGPDGYLYVSIGDRLEFTSEDLTVPTGKILRLRKENGAAAPDNPFLGEPEADPRIFAYGLRNTIDFTFNPESGVIYGNESHTERCHELNIIKAGQDYGWPASRLNLTCGRPKERPESIPGIYSYASSGRNPEDVYSYTTPTGIEFVTGDRYPRLRGSLLICEFVTKFMRRLELSGDEQDEVVADEVATEDCSLDIATSPDGVIYYSNETEIRRLVPE